MDLLIVHCDFIIQDAPPFHIDESEADGTTKDMVSTRFMVVHTPEFDAAHDGEHGDGEIRPGVGHQSIQDKFSTCVTRPRAQGEPSISVTRQRAQEEPPLVVTQSRAQDELSRLMTRSRAQHSRRFFLTYHAKGRPCAWSRFTKWLQRENNHVISENRNCPQSG